MRQIALMIAVSCAVSPLAAAETRVLRGAEVQAALEGRKRVQGSGARR
ncbi:hypothetical protein [Leisingera thetidis]|nr:hypothetical protein [Leisingera thetidis]